MIPKGLVRLSVLNPSGSWTSRPGSGGCDCGGGWGYQPAAAVGCLMIMARNGRISTATGRDHEDGRERFGSRRPIRSRKCRTIQLRSMYLLSGSAPLRGRASMEMIIRPFGYRDAAEFWHISDPRLAVLVHSVVGGTPAYRREFVAGDSPAYPAGFDAWVLRTVLNPQLRFSARPATCSRKRPTSATPPSTMPYSARSPQVTPPEAESPTTSGVSHLTSGTRSPYWKTPN
jgi:hypothetical protein